jgi:Peptidase A4 family
MRRYVVWACMLLMSVGLSSLAAAGPSSASTVGLSVSCSNSTLHTCTAKGAGFTPGKAVLVSSYAGSTALGSITVTASASNPPPCDTTGRVICRTAPVIGGAFTTALPLDTALACDATAAGTVTARDETNGATVSQPVTWTGPCATPTTTTLTLPSVVDTAWTAVVNPVNPVRVTVTAGSAAVTVGTVTITVNGATVCSYTAADLDGCTLANLPAGTDTVVASYSGTPAPPYDASSASATLTVLAVQSPVPTTTPNWSGYVATDDTYTAVSGSWTVPKVNCGVVGSATSSTWVGLDGFGGGPVEQIGTGSNCILGSGTYFAWWEMYPDSPHKITCLAPTTNCWPVSYGDVMDASVRSTGQPGQYTLTLSDSDQGWTFTTTQSISGATGASAEWITEQPDVFGVQLANFDHVIFNQCEATGSNGSSTPIWDHPNYAIEMVNGTTAKAMVSPLSNDGTTFTDTFRSH